MSPSGKGNGYFSAPACGGKSTAGCSRIPTRSAKPSELGIVKAVPNFGKLPERWDSKMINKTAGRRTVTSAPTANMTADCYPASSQPCRTAVTSANTPARRVLVSTPTRQRVFAPHNPATPRVVLSCSSQAPRTPGGPRLSPARRVPVIVKGKINSEPLEDNVELSHRGSLYAGPLRVPVKNTNLANAVQAPPRTPSRVGTRLSGPVRVLQTPKNYPIPSTPHPQRTPRVCAIAKTQQPYSHQTDDDHVLDRGFRELEYLVDDIGAEVEKRADERRATALTLARAAEASDGLLAPSPSPVGHGAPQLPSVSAMLGNVNCGPFIQPVHLEGHPPGREDSWRDVVGIPSATSNSAA
ncbi:hypothetical protein HDU86_007394 [Geranomyces michiganensis]|nr:hypothetical protein HDU86_007394 [Geranomyces michiganensis]